MSAGAPPMRSRRAWWPWLVVAAFLGLAVTGSILVAANGGSVAEQVPFIIAFSMFGIVGALITSRVPNRIGALLLWCSGVTAASFVGGETATYLIRNGTTEGTLVVSMGLLSTLGWLFGIMPAILFIPQVFPDGHVLTRRWLVLAWGTIFGLILLGVWAVFGAETITGSVESAEIANPLYIPAVGKVELSEAAFLIVILGSLIGGVISLIVRFRRSRGVERQQVKWVAAAAGFLAATFVLSPIAESLGGPAFLFETILSALAFLSFPVAIGVGVLQYRLYELDVVIKKALIAGTLVLIVIGAYAALVAVFGAVASGRESSASLFALALLLGIAFRPVTRFARRVADRIVYGRRATPYEVLTEFSERVGGSYATEDVLGRMATILGEGVGAETARVWLRVGDELRPSSAWPADASGAAPLRVPRDAVPEIAGETAVEVRDGEVLLGALSVAMPANDPMTPAKERLVRDLASQARLVLRNVRLVEELRASQRRIVAAQDEERRRLERNIHDGAQQQLVALTVKMRLAQSLAGKDVEKTETMLAQMQEETQTALQDLRDLARGIYPPLLADQGLAAAFEAQARKSPVPVTVESDGIGRHPQEVEAAVYFSVLEALQNVAKYAEAERVTVRLGQDQGSLVFEVADDGKGFDQGSVPKGSGLQGIADRLGALEGTVEVRSSPGAGTVITGRLPVGVGPSQET